jgi:hypothetical protein
MKQYKTLKIENGYTTVFKLEDDLLDFNKVYDIKTLSGHEFKLCDIFTIVKTYSGRGGMDESTTNIIAYFIADGLKTILENGFLMRENKEGIEERNRNRDDKLKKDKIEFLKKRKLDLESEMLSIDNTLKQIDI